MIRRKEFYHECVIASFGYGEFCVFFCLLFGVGGVLRYVLCSGACGFVYELCVVCVVCCVLCVVGCLMHVVLCVLSSVFSLVGVASLKILIV